MKDLPDPDVLLGVIAERMAMLRSMRSRKLSPFDWIAKKTSDDAHVEKLGADCFHRVELLGDFSEVGRKVGGPLCNAMITIALSYEQEQRARFECAYVSHMDEVYDGTFPRNIDPDRVTWPRPIVNELRRYRTVIKFYDQCIELARSVSEPVEGETQLAGN